MSVGNYAHDVTAVAERQRTGVVDRVERWVFAGPLWALTAVVLAGATVLHGFHWSTSIYQHLLMALDPWSQSPDVPSYGYSSPLGAILGWLVGADSFGDVARVNYVVAVVIICGCVAAIRKWESDIAARLFLLAYWCSPQSWANTAFLGAYDVFTLGALTLSFVAPAGVCIGAGVVLGFNHFEQGGIALAAIAFIRIVMRRQTWQPMAAAFAGLIVGKVILLAYLAASDISPVGRIEYIREQGLHDIVAGWNGELLTLEWAVYNVLWVGMIWMLWTMRRGDRERVIAMHLLLTVPVLLTFDLSRVYRNLTWPLVLLLVIYAAQWPDRRLVQRWALALAVAAILVPRTEIFAAGLRING
jgi:hypothetical protein